MTLGILAEYGAFEIVRFQTFTTAIFTEFSLGFDTPGACAQSLVLVGLGLLVLSGECQLGRQGKDCQNRSRGAPSQPPCRSGWPQAAGPDGPGAPGRFLPGSSFFFNRLLDASRQLLNAAPGQSFSATLATLAFSAGAGAIATLMAVPVARFSLKSRSWVGATSRESGLSSSGHSWSGGRPISCFLCHSDSAGSLPDLIFVDGCLRPHVLSPGFGCHPILGQSGSCKFGGSQRCPWVRQECWSSSGQPFPFSSRASPHPLPLSFFHPRPNSPPPSCFTPTGVQTLATQFWRYSSEVSYGAAAPYAALIVAISVLPALLVSRRMDRWSGAEIL